MMWTGRELPILSVIRPMESSHHVRIAASEPDFGRGVTSPLVGFSQAIPFGRVRSDAEIGSRPQIRPNGVGATDLALPAIQDDWSPLGDYTRRNWLADQAY